MELAEHYRTVLDQTPPYSVKGRVTKIVGQTIEGVCPALKVGGLCLIHPLDGHLSCLAEVVGFRNRHILLMPLSETKRIGYGSILEPVASQSEVYVGEALKGRILNGMGEPVDHGPPLLLHEKKSIYNDAPDPMKRGRIQEPFDIGIKSINGLLTLAKGQKIAIVAGAGVGKSNLLGMMARHASSDINVIGLIGERGREVKEFIDKNLGPEGLARSVIIVATSDMPPLLKIRAAFLTTAIAEYFAEKGYHVNLMMDSLTRFSMAQREIGLAIGEPPTTKGYTPSVFALLPKLLERAGTTESAGTITGLYTVLVESDDLTDPIADSVESIVDGHIILSRKLASRGHYPAVDILLSLSRCMADVTSPDHQKLAITFRDIYHAYTEAEELIMLGAYLPGKNKKIDFAMKRMDQISDFLIQPINQKVDLESAINQLRGILANTPEEGTDNHLEKR